MASRTLDLIIKAISDGKGVAQITKELKQGQQGVKDFNKTGAEAADATKASTGKMSDSFTSLTSVILPAIGAATAVVATFKKAMEFSEEGAALQRLEESSYSMARSVGLDMREVVSALRDASMNTISDTDLMATATKAMMLGVGSSAQQMAELMEVATIRGRALGLSATQAFSDIMTGIGRGSKLILDNLGIILDLDKVYSDYAKTLNTTSAALTDQQKKEAMTQAVIRDTADLIEETGGLIEDSMTKLEQYDAASKNFWDNRKKDSREFASNLKGLFYEFFKVLNEGEERTDLFTEAMGKIPEAFLREWPFMKMMANGLNDELGQMSLHIIDLQTTFGNGIFTSQKTQAIVDYYIALHEAGIETDNLTSETKALKTAWDYAKKALDENNISLSENIALQQALALASGEITKGDVVLQGAVDMLTESFADGDILQNRYIDSLEAMQAAALAGGSIVAALSTALEGMPREIRTKILIEQYGMLPGGSEITIPENTGTVGGGSDGNWQRAGIGWQVNTETGEYREAPWEKAHGGLVQGGQEYLVNEVRPEVFIPKSDGVIVPIGAAAQQMMGGGVTINLYGTVIREDADIERIAAEIARKMRK